MGTLIVIVVVLAAIAVYATHRRNVERRRIEARKVRDLESVREVVEEDVTALGEELRQLDVDMVGHDLDEGARSDYQRGLDAYEAAKSAVTEMRHPDDVRHVTEILDDGRYAIACVHARVEDRELPTRRPACFFDPRHGISVEDVLYTPPGGVERDVPACALDAERVKAGAEPDVRKVLDGAQRVPYWQAGPAYSPYAAGYFGANLMPMLFLGTMMGTMWGGGFDGSYGEGYDAGFDAGGAADGGSGGGGDFGGGDGGGWFDGGGGFDGGGFGGGDFGGF